MASIHKRRLSSGRVVWELCHGSGRDRQRLVAGRTREEAQEMLKQFERQLALHGKAPSDDTLDAVHGQYLTFLRGNRRHGTIRRYQRVLQTFFECFLHEQHPEVVTIRQIKPLHVEEYKTKRATGGVLESPGEDVRAREQRLRSELAAQPHASTWRDNAKYGWLGRKRLRTVIAPRTINYELQVLRTFFRWAVSRNYVLANPAVVVERLRVSKRALPKFLTTEQLRKLFEVCDDGERRLFIAILLTGMRKGEVAHLTWSDINFEMGVIFIQEKPQWNWKPKTDERIIPISPNLREIFHRQHADRRSDVLVFPNKEGHVDNHILHKFQNACRRAGVGHSNVHALRHSFGAHLRMAGVSLADIADLLGHKDLATTQIYAKVHQEHLRAAISRLTPLVDDTSPTETLPRLIVAPGADDEPTK